MANIIIPNEKRREDTKRVLHDYRKPASDKEAYEQAECIAAKSQEAREQLRKGER